MVPPMVLPRGYLQTQHNKKKSYSGGMVLLMVLPRGYPQNYNNNYNITRRRKYQTRVVWIGSSVGSPEGAPFQRKKKQTRSTTPDREPRRRTIPKDKLHYLLTHHITGGGGRTSISLLGQTPTEELSSARGKKERSGEHAPKATDLAPPRPPEDLKK